MKPKLKDLLRCPTCVVPMELRDAVEERGDITSGALVCTKCAKAYPIVRGVPRFVDSDGYSSTFGFQWNEFRETQLDSHVGVPVSRDRFLAVTKWDSLEGQLVLDGGCGAGRFAEVAVSLGGEIVAIDYSSAVEAAWRNVGSSPRMHVVQANIYALPFAPGTFDKMYSLGVLQHTPDVKAATMALIRMVRRGGELALDYYLKSWTRFFDPKYLLRPITRRIPHERLFGLVKRVAPPLLTLSNAVGKVPVVGRYLRRIVPVANYTGVLPLSKAQLREWAILDTFDWLSPAFDQPQTPATIRAWLEEARLEKIEVAHIHHLAGRARVPVTNEQHAD